MSHDNTEKLPPELEGAKLIFGDKIVDPKDARICHPHSRVVPENPAINPIVQPPHRPKSSNSEK